LDDYADSFETKTSLMWGLYHLANEQNRYNENREIIPKRYKFWFYPEFRKYKDSHIETALKRVLRNIENGVIMANEYNGIVIHKALQSRFYKPITLILDDESYNGELIGLSDNVYTIGSNNPELPTLGLMFIGDDVYKIENDKIYLC
jgi:hypothetical protein